MTEEELQKLVETISLKYFGRPFKHKVKINRRLTTTGGRYHLQDHHLEFNVHFLVPEERASLVGIIKHELVHYHLHLAGRDYHHRSQDFKRLLAKVDGLRYTPDIGLQRQYRKYHYVCQKCGQVYLRKRRVNTKRYFCGRCHGKLLLK